MLCKKTLICFLILSLLSCQLGFAQMTAELNIAGHLRQMQQPLSAQKFRPIHLRYFSYDTHTDKLNIIVDKGTVKNADEATIKDTTQTLLTYFLTGVVLPNESFWVNLRPDSAENIIDNNLAQTDMGKIMLEADLQLKKDTARFTSPQTKEGKEYWDKLYSKAGELFGTNNVTIPTLTRPWIVPNEVIIREDNQSAYIYKATLLVMLEEDHLKESAVYNFTDPRLKELNEYSAQLIRELILPRLTKEVNSAERYAGLRQVFYSLILARWFKSRFKGKDGLYCQRIDSGDLTGISSKDSWSKDTFFNAYQESFRNGEYNLRETTSTLQGSNIRSYFSGGMDLRGTLTIPTASDPTPRTVGGFTGSGDIVLGIMRNTNMTTLAGQATNEGNGTLVITPGLSRGQNSPGSTDDVALLQGQLSYHVRQQLGLQISDDQLQGIATRIGRVGTIITSAHLTGLGLTEEVSAALEGFNTGIFRGGMPAEGIEATVTMRPQAAPVSPPVLMAPMRGPGTSELLTDLNAQLIIATAQLLTGDSEALGRLKRIRAGYAHVKRTGDSPASSAATQKITLIDQAIRRVEDAVAQREVASAVIDPGGNMFAVRAHAKASLEEIFGGRSKEIADIEHKSNRESRAMELAALKITSAYWDILGRYPTNRELAKHLPQNNLKTVFGKIKLGLLFIPIFIFDIDIDTVVEPKIDFVTVRDWLRNKQGTLKEVAVISGLLRDLLRARGKYDIARHSQLEIIADRLIKTETTTIITDAYLDGVDLPETVLSELRGVYVYDIPKLVRESTSITNSIPTTLFRHAQDQYTTIYGTNRFDNRDFRVVHTIVSAYWDIVGGLSNEQRIRQLIASNPARVREILRSEERSNATVSVLVDQLTKYLTQRGIVSELNEREIEMLGVAADRIIKGGGGVIQAEWLRDIVLLSETGPVSCDTKVVAALTALNVDISPGQITLRMAEQRSGADFIVRQLQHALRQVSPHVSDDQLGPLAQRLEPKLAVGYKITREDLADTGLPPEVCDALLGLDIGLFMGGMPVEGETQATLQGPAIAAEPAFQNPVLDKGTPSIWADLNSRATAAVLRLRNGDRTALNDLIQVRSEYSLLGEGKSPQVTAAAQKMPGLIGKILQTFEPAPAPVPTTGVVPRTSTQMLREHAETLARKILPRDMYMRYKGDVHTRVVAYWDILNRLPDDFEASPVGMDVAHTRPSLRQKAGTTAKVAAIAGTLREFLRERGLYDDTDYEALEIIADRITKYGGGIIMPDDVSDLEFRQPQAKAALRGQNIDLSQLALGKALPDAEAVFIMPQLFHALAGVRSQVSYEQLFPLAKRLVGKVAPGYRITETDVADLELPEIVTQKLIGLDTGPTTGNPAQDTVGGFSGAEGLSPVMMHPDTMTLARQADLEGNGTLVFTPDLPSEQNPPTTTQQFGGIDFRTIRITAQPLGTFSALELSLPALSRLEEIDLDTEFGQITAMVNASILPSAERIKEYLAGCIAKKEFAQRSPDLFACLTQICRLEEDENIGSSDDLKQLLVIVDNL